MTKKTKDEEFADLAKYEKRIEFKQFNTFIYVYHPKGFELFKKYFLEKGTLKKTISGKTINNGAWVKSNNLTSIIHEASHLTDFIAMAIFPKTLNNTEEFRAYTTAYIANIWQSFINEIDLQEK